MDTGFQINLHVSGFFRAYRKNTCPEICIKMGPDSLCWSFCTVSKKSDIGNANDYKNLLLDTLLLRWHRKEITFNDNKTTTWASLRAQQSYPLLWFLAGDYNSADASPLSLTGTGYTSAEAWALKTLLRCVMGCNQFITTGAVLYHDKAGRELAGHANRAFIRIQSFSSHFHFALVTRLCTKYRGN